MILDSNLNFPINLETKERIMTITFYSKSKLWIFTFLFKHIFFITFFLKDDFVTFLLILYYTIFSFKILFMKITIKHSINEQKNKTMKITIKIKTLKKSENLLLFKKGFFFDFWECILHQYLLFISMSSK